MGDSDGDGRSIVDTAICSKPGWDLAGQLLYGDSLHCSIFLQLRGIHDSGVDWTMGIRGRVAQAEFSFEVVVVFGTLSLVAQFVYWSRIVSGLNQEHT